MQLLSLIKSRRQEVHSSSCHRGRSKKHGQGQFMFANGDVYEGQWEADNQHGQGMHTWASGQYLEGQWPEW